MRNDDAVAISDDAYIKGLLGHCGVPGAAARAAAKPAGGPAQSGEHARCVCVSVCLCVCVSVHVRASACVCARTHTDALNARASACVCVRARVHRMRAPANVRACDAASLSFSADADVEAEISLADAINRLRGFEQIAQYSAAMERAESAASRSLRACVRACARASRHALLCMCFV
jgi:hypothetical protein